MRGPPVPMRQPPRSAKEHNAQRLQGTLTSVRHALGITQEHKDALPNIAWDEFEIQAQTLALSFFHISIGDLHNG